MSTAQPIVFLMGPTASGKTDCAIELASRLDIEIISVDSAMVYRGLDIGSGKPDYETLQRAPHRLIDIRDPDEPYSAASFRLDALDAIKQIHERGSIPLLVGGTSLYFRALRNGLSPLPSADPVIRKRLEGEAQEAGLDALHQRLARLDPAAAARIHRTDAQRIQRALEVIEITGDTLSALHARDAGEQCPFPVHAFSLEPENRAWLHERIERRFEGMLAAGFEQEVRELRSRHRLSAELPAVRAVGYRQMHDYLDERTDHSTMVHRAVVATRQLARRQLTWLRREPVHERIKAENSQVAAHLYEAVNRCLGDAG
ncbi:MAG: tRNA dimethylallyltransferase [Gammaproteobacteria bacterium]|jgi:tRNA dimethylallyltransferase